MEKLAVAFVARAGRQQLDPVGPTLERTDHPGRDAYGVEGFELQDLVVELDAAGAGEHDVDLLRVLVSVREPLPLARANAVVADTGLLRLEIARGEASLLELGVAELGSGVFDVCELHVRVWSGHARKVQRSKVHNYLMTKTQSASEQITEEVTSWPGVEAGPGRRGEFAFKVGRREIGHLHGDHAAHFSFPKDVWADLMEQGRVVEHPVFPGKAGPAARRIENEADTRDVIELMRLNYDRAVARHGLP